MLTYVYRSISWTHSFHSELSNVSNHWQAARIPLTILAVLPLYVFNQPTNLTNWASSLVSGDIQNLPSSEPSSNTWTNSSTSLIQVRTYICFINWFILKPALLMLLAVKISAQNCLRTKNAIASSIFLCCSSKSAITSSEARFSSKWEERKRGCDNVIVKNSEGS